MAEGSKAPADRGYTKEHEWALVQGDEVTVGITDHAASELGDVVYVSLPAVGEQVTQFEKFGEIESVKAVSDLYSPVSGEVVAVSDMTLPSVPASYKRGPKRHQPCSATGHLEPVRAGEPFDGVLAPDWIDL